MSVGSLQQPTMKLYHLMVPHAPFQLNRNLEVEHLPFDNEGFLEQSRAALEVLRRFFGNLHDLGIYDSSLILVVSDHGGGRYTSSVDTTLLGESLQSGVAQTATIPGHHHAAGLPLILIKPPAEHGLLEVSDAPVSLGDMARTISEILEIGKHYSGRNMFDIDPDEQRTRHFYYYEFSVWSREYLPDMIEYQVDGYSWFPESWSTTGRVLSPAVSALEQQRPVYRLSDRMHFKPGSPYTTALVKGWSDPLADGLVWSRSAEAVIEFELSEEIQAPIIARFDFMPFTAGGEIALPTVELVVNGELHESWSTENRGWHQVQIPAEVVHGTGYLEFKFRLPDAASPFEFGRSLDARSLGIALYGVELDYAEAHAEQ